MTVPSATSRTNEPRTEGTANERLRAESWTDPDHGFAVVPLQDAERELNLLYGIIERLAEAAQGAAPRAEPLRLFYSGTHGSTCPNCEQFVAGERYHIPDVMGYTGPPGACMERRADEPILPAQGAAPRSGPSLEVQFWKSAGEWQKAGAGMTKEQETGAAMVWSWLDALRAASRSADTGVRADPGVDRSLPSEAGRALHSSGPPGTAPRAERLPSVEALEAFAEILRKLIRQYHGIAHSHLGRAKRGGSWLYCDDRWCSDIREVLGESASRPSDERVPESEEPR